MQETFKKHVSVLYLLCPTVPPRVLSNDQWWEVVKEVGSLCHVIPLIEKEGFESDSLSQIEYLILQFIQSDPPLLAIRWLMSLYSLINKYIKLSVSKLSKEFIFLIHKFTGIEIDYTINMEKVTDKNGFNYCNSYNPSKVTDCSQIYIDNLSVSSLLDLRDMTSRGVQPNFVITSFYVLETLLRIEIMETRKDIPNLCKLVPQLMLHVDKRMRNASNEFLLTIIHLGVPGYSLGSNLMDKFIPIVKSLVELDDFVNVQRVIQSIILIFKQYPKLVSTRHQEVLQLIVDISSSLVEENNSLLSLKDEKKDTAELLSYLLANTVYIDYNSDNILEGFKYITEICNIQFSTYGLASYPIQGECFRIIISNSMLILFELYENNYWNNERKHNKYLYYIEKIRDLILSNFQNNYIKKHITDNFQWLTNNHWVFLWRKIFEKITIKFTLFMQETMFNDNNNNENWKLFKNFILPLVKISPGDAIECIYNVMNEMEHENCFWKMNYELQGFMLDWIFRISFTSNFEIHNSSYYSGSIASKLIQCNNSFNIQREKLASLFNSLLTFNKIDDSSFLIESNYSQSLIHYLHFLIGLSNCTLNSSSLLTILEFVVGFIVKLPELNYVINQEAFNGKLFLLNNILLVLNNILSNIISIENNSNNDENFVFSFREDNTTNMSDSLKKINDKIIPICVNMISNENIDNVIAILDSLIESSERFQLIKQSNELTALNLFDDDKDNPIILLFKDFKLWIFIIWNSLKLIKLFIILNEFVCSINNVDLNREGKSKTDINSIENNQYIDIPKLQRYIIKSSFNIVNNFLPNIPRNWASLLPDSKLLNDNDKFLSLLIKSELMSFKMNKHDINATLTSLASVEDSDLLSNFDRDYSTMKRKYTSILRENSDSSKYEDEITVETFEKFVFPFIGDSFCFSRYVHFSRILILLKQTVYKELNEGFFKYKNHPELSLNTMNMIILDLISDPLISFFNIRYPMEVFPLYGSSERKFRVKHTNNISDFEIKNSYKLSNNDIFSLLDHCNIGECTHDCNKNSSLLSNFSLLESMKTITEYPCIIDRAYLNSTTKTEISFRVETSELISNLLFENIENDLFGTVKLLFKLLYMKTIHNSTYWSYVIPECNYFKKENGKMNVVNLFSNYFDLSPTLYITSIRSIATAPNDSTVISILSIFFFVKSFARLLINKIDELLVENGNNNCGNTIAIMNKCYNTLTYIFSSTFKYLFGKMKMNNEKDNDLNDSKPKSLSPPRVKSSVLRYYLINFLYYLLDYFNTKKEVFNYYNILVGKLHNITIDYLGNNKHRETQDNDTIIDIHLFLLKIKYESKTNYDNKLLGIIESFFNAENNKVNTFENTGLHILKLNKEALVNQQNRILNDIVSFHFGIDEMNGDTNNFNEEKIEDLKISEYKNYMNSIGECLCFYNYEELSNTGIFNSIIKYVSIVINYLISNNLVKSDDDLLNNLIVVSLSLIYQTRIHEVPLIEYNTCIYLPFEFKYILSGFISDLYILISRAFNDEEEGTYKVRNFNDFEPKNAPALNLLLILLINYCFINNDLSIMNSISSYNFETLKLNYSKYSIMLMKWIIDNNVKYASVSHLRSYLNVLSVPELVDFSLNTIRYSTIEKKSTQNDYYNLNRTSEILKCLFDDSLWLNNLTSPLYIQLNPYFYYSDFLSLFNKDIGNLTNNYKDLIYSSNLFVTTYIIKVVFELIDSKLSNEKPKCNFNKNAKPYLGGDYIYKNKEFLPLVSHFNSNNNIFENSGNNAYTLNFNLEVNTFGYDTDIYNHNLEQMTVFVFNMASFLMKIENHISGINREYLNDYLLIEYLYILKLILKTQRYCDNLKISKLDPSDLVYNALKLLKSIESSLKCSGDTIYILFIHLVDLLVCLYDNLENGDKGVLWEMVVNIVYRNNGVNNSNIDFSSMEMLTLYNLISKNFYPIKIVDKKKDNHFNIVFSEDSQRKLILIYKHLISYLISQNDSFDGDNVNGLIFCSNFSYFLMNNITHLRQKTEENNSMEIFSPSNIHCLIRSILRYRSKNIGDSMIYCIPSIIPIWNLFSEKAKRYNKTIVDILVLEYSDSNKDSFNVLNSLLFLLEVIHSLYSLLLPNSNTDGNHLDKNIAIDSAFIEPQDLNVSIKNIDFKSIVLLYYRELNTENKSVDHNNKQDILFIFIIYHYFVNIGELHYNKFKKLYEIEMYVRVYKLMFDYYITLIIAEYNVENNIKIDYIIKTNKHLLQLLKKVMLSPKMANTYTNENKVYSKSIENMLLNLIVDNSKYIICENIDLVLKETLILDSHINWIENEIKDSITDVKNKDCCLNFINKLLDIIFNILVFSYKNINSSSVDNKLNQSRIKDKCFVIFKYLLFSSSYVHSDYFSVIDNYLKRADKQVNTDHELEVGVVPDFRLYKKYHESLLGIVLFKFENYLNEINNSEFNLDLFNCLKAVTLPFSFTYSIEFLNNNQNGIKNNDLYVLKYPNKRCLNIIKNLRNDTKNSHSLNESIDNYINNYLKILNNTEYTNLFSFEKILEYISNQSITDSDMDDHFHNYILIPSAITLVWFLVIHEKKSDVLKNSLGIDIEMTNKGEYVEKNKYNNVIKWLRVNDFFIPRGKEHILIEFILK